MWIQLLSLAGAFGLGFYFATRGAGAPKTATTAPLSDDGATIVGAFPAQGKPVDCNDSSEGLSSKKKNNKSKNKGKVKRHAKQQALSNLETPDSVQESSLPEAAKALPQEDVGVEGDANDDAIELDNSSDDARTYEEEAAADEWTAVDSASAARPIRQAPAGIPTHASVWSGLAREEDLGREKESPTPARVLRIGSPARPPPTGPVRVRQEYTNPEPLTKKQRQNQRKTERLREQRTINTEVQDHRLRQHQIALADLRSREQWTKAKRTAAKTAMPPPRSSKAPSSSASVIEGKLVWD
ncbi:hypothetical protein GGI00_000223 [Coemansia sp. RSA 2681]|nr:hypothetical protein GGI00_000223 [Coemansia sp. RSA 2681]